MMTDVMPERLQQTLFDSMSKAGSMPNYRVTIEPAKLSPQAEWLKGQAWSPDPVDPPTLREMLAVLAVEYPGADLECDPALLDRKINSVRVVEPRGEPLSDGMITWTMNGLTRRPAGVLHLGRCGTGGISDWRS